MASQRVLVLAIGGALAEDLWKDIVRWSDSRTTSSNLEWSPDAWPESTRTDVDACAETAVREWYEPPVLYRSEHVDCWSMGDVFTSVMEIHCLDSRQLLTERYGLYVGWSAGSHKPTLPAGASQEAQWLNSRLYEASDAWKPIVGKRLFVLVRMVLDGLWTDAEVEQSLNEIPAWRRNDN